MEGKSTHEIFKEELGVMEEGMKRLSTTKEDIWQDELVWWLCKAVRDLMLYVFTIKMPKGGEENGRGN